MKKYLFLATLLLAITPMTFAVPTYSFKAVTANSVADVAIGEAQLFVEVTDPGSGQVLFTFKNIGSAASSITDVYFDDGTLLGIASIQDGTGVDFEQGANPGDLPCDENIGFETTEGFSADSEPPRQPNGVNPGEHVGILFNLQTGRTFDDVLGDLDSRALRIGIHVQGFSDDESESFVNNGLVPAPGAVLLGGIGVTLVGWMRRRRTL